MRQVQQEIDMEEFAWWAAYDALEPLTPPSAEQVALIAATMVNMQLVRSTPRTHVEDFLPGYERQPMKPQSPQDIERNLMMTLGLN